MECRTKRPHQIRQNAPNFKTQHPLVEDNAPKVSYVKNEEFKENFTPTSNVFFDQELLKRN